MLQSNQAVDGKSIVLIHPRDNSGCSHVRLRWNANLFNAVDYGFNCVVSLHPIFDNNILMMTKAIVCQRFTNEHDLMIIKAYKDLQPKYRYKLIFEVDDQCFRINGKGIPEYNTAGIKFNTEVNNIEKILHETLPLYDEIVVSTDYLKMCFEQIFNCHNIRVIKNVVPRYLWSTDRKKEITSDLVKPKVLYSGSPCHYRDPIEKGVSSEFPNGLLSDRGDWNNAWPDWVIRNVKNGKIDFVVMGSLPFFFQEIKDRIKIINWVDCNTYPRVVMAEHADFQIAPLVENDFNRCKSSLRFTESCAAGTVMLGTVFSGSPYNEIPSDCKVNTNATVDDIDNIFWNLCKKDNYNRVLNEQYDFINKNQCWIESQGHINDWLAMVDGYNCVQQLI